MKLTKWGLAITPPSSGWRRQKWISWNTLGTVMLSCNMTELFLL